MTPRQVAEKIVYLADHNEGMYVISEGERLIKKLMKPKTETEYYKCPKCCRNISTAFNSCSTCNWTNEPDTLTEPSKQFISR
jgi:hypothetical protein